LYRRVPSTALPIHLFRHFNCGQPDHVTMAIPEAAFSAVRFCNYTVRRTQYDRHF